MRRGGLRPRLQRAFGAVLLLALGACAGGPTAAPQPVMGSGPLRGQIQQGVYRDPLRWFEITLPYHPDEDSYARLRVDEDKLPNVEYASFMPLTAPGEYYRVYIEDFKTGGHPVPELPQV